MRSERTRLLTGNAAAAWGARLAEAEYVPAFPITPQTEIIEALAQWVDTGEMRARLVTLESEHSMITAAGTAAATGVRVFTATSSQGLLYAMEMLYTVAGWRAPFVLVNVSRAVAAPLTLECDHNDVLAARDSGFLQIHAATCQEALDSVLIAYRVAEDRRVRLPALVNLDGFQLSFTREPVEVPDPDSVRRFLPPFDASTLRFRAREPISQAVAVMGGALYSYFRYQTHLAARNAELAFEDASLEFARAFGRRHDSLERYRCEGADIVFFMMGSSATKAMDAVDRLREEGQRIGLVRPRLLRPLPTTALLEALSGRRAVIVVDQNVSLGMGGVLHGEVASALYDEPGKPMLVNFIGGLGGRDIATEELMEMVEVTRHALDTGVVPPPHLLYTRDEWNELRKLQHVAHARRESNGATP